MERFVFTEHFSECSGSLQAENVTLELEFAQNLVCKQHASDVLPLLVLDSLTTEMQTLDGGIIGHNL